MRSLTALVLAFFMLPTASLAQSDAFARGVISDDERDAVVMTLGLDDEQVVQLDRLAEVHDARCVEIVGEFERARADLAGSIDSRESRIEAVKNLIRMRYDTQQALAETRDAFLKEVELLLTEAQRPLMERCAWRLTRLRLLRELSSVVSGISADPVTVSRALGLPNTLLEDEREAFEDAMFRYDKAVAQRLTELQETQREMVEVAQELPDLDPTDPAFLKIARESLDLMIETRDVHNARASSIAITLPADLRPAWEAEWKRQSFPTVYADSWSERAFTLLLAQRTLTDDQREEIQRVRDDYARRVAPVRTAWADAIEEAEAGASVEETYTGLVVGSDDLDDARERMLELDRSSRRHLVRILGRERVEDLPPLNADDRP